MKFETAMLILIFLLLAGTVVGSTVGMLGDWGGLIVLVIFMVAVLFVVYLFCKEATRDIQKAVS